MGNLNPYYNESFVFVVEQEMLRVRRALTFIRSFLYSLASCPVALAYFWGQYTNVYKMPWIDAEHSKRQEIQKSDITRKRFPLDTPPIFQTQIKWLVAFECSSWLLN